MNSALEFLKKAGVFYLATENGDQPKVRPFGIAASCGGRLYICTKDGKDCFLQMTENPKVEICAMAGEDWIRITGRVAVDSERGAKEALLEQNPHARDIYSIDDPHFAVLYFAEGSASVYRAEGGIVPVPLV